MPDLPTLLERADGQDGRLGIPDPEGAVQFSGVTQAGQPTDDPAQHTVCEDPESPELERAEQATITKRFNLMWPEALTRIQYLGRGQLLFDSEGNATKVLSAKIQHQKGGRATLVVVSEGVSFDSPPDQFEIMPVSLGVNILKHPRYFYALMGSNSVDESRNQMVIRRLQDYFEQPTATYRDAVTKQIYDSLGTPAGSSTKIAGTDMAKRAALEIIQKYWRGEENPYVVGYQIVWTSFYFRPPYLNPGGYVEDPILDANPQLPDYFWSPDYPPNPSVTIFDAITSVNPQCYSQEGTAGGTLQISWLREADRMEEQRTWFKLVRSWKGSPVGFWDAELYTSADRPLVPDDYLPINPALNPKAVTT